MHSNSDNPTPARTVVISAMTVDRLAELRRKAADMLGDGTPSYTVHQHQQIPHWLNELLDEVARLRALSKVDGPVFNAGRAEGQSDIKARLRKIVDPEDQNHWDIDGVMSEVERLRKDLELTRGAMAAQDQREREAGEKCGVSWLEVGWDWPNWVADEVLSLRANAERLKKDNSGLHEIQDLQREHIVERDRRIAELEQWQRDMVNKAAEKSLDGYRELGAEAAQAEEQRDAALEQFRLAMQAIDWFRTCMLGGVVHNESALWVEHNAAAGPRDNDRLSAFIRSLYAPDKPGEKIVFDTGNARADLDATFKQIASGNAPCLATLIQSIRSAKAAAAAHNIHFGPGDIDAAIDKFTEGGHVWDGVDSRALRAGVPLDNPERYTPNDEYFHPCPPDGCHIERMDDGLIWMRCGEARFVFSGGPKRTVIWRVDIGNESEVVEAAETK